MDKIVVKIKGLDCANCARELEEELNNIEALQAKVDFMNMKVTLESESMELIDKAKYIISHFEEVEIVKDLEKISIKIEGLDCANCALELEEELNKLDNIEAQVDFMNMKVTLYSDSEQAINKAKYVINHFEEVKIVEDENESKDSHKKDIICLIVSALLFIPAIIIANFVSTIAGKVISYILYVAAYVVVGHEVLINTVKNLSKGRIFDENFLMTLASLGAMVLGFINDGDGLFEGVAVMYLYQLGELLQSLAVGKSRDSITKLMDLKSNV